MNIESIKNRVASVSEQPEAYFLKPGDEAFLVGLPIIGIALTLGLWFLGRFGLSWRISDVSLMLAGIIFIDGIHVVFSFMLLVMLPELRTWAASEDNKPQKGWSKGLSFWTHTGLIAIALGVCAFLLRVYPGTFSIRGMAMTFLLIEILGPAQHTIAQMRGISFCYNGALRRTYKFSEEERAIATTNEKIERLLFTALLVGEVFYWIPDIFNLDHFNIPGIDSVHFVGGVMSIASVAGLIVNSLYFPKQGNSRKSAFLFRLALFPLKMLTTVGGIFLRAAHGTEYLVIFKRMVQGSKISNRQKTKIFLITAIASVAYIFFFVLTWPVAITELLGQEPPSMLFGVALVFTFIVRYTHYYTDSIVYRMSNPVTRAAVGPLLTAAPYERVTLTAKEVPARGLRRGKTLQKQPGKSTVEIA